MGEDGPSRGESLTSAEERFLAALRDHEKCDFSNGAEISFADMATWQDDRVLRSTVIDFALRRLAADVSKENRPRLEVRGAVIQGPLYEYFGAELVGFSFEACVFNDYLSFSKCNFDGNATFTGCHFRDRVDFNNCKFPAYFKLADSNFDEQLSFRDCEFYEPTMFENIGTKSVDFSSTLFRKTSWLTRLKCSGDAHFYGTRFGENAYFEDWTISGDISLFQSEVIDSLNFKSCTFAAGVRVSSGKCGSAFFSACNFLGEVSFSGTKFLEEAFFARCIFYDAVNFNEVSFGGKLTLWCATFMETIKFYRSSFQEVSFENAIANNWDFSNATFNLGDVGPIVGLKINLKKVVLATRGRFVAAASTIEAPWLTVQHGAHMVIRADSVTLNDSEFSKRSIISSYGPEDLNKLRDLPISDDDSSEEVGRERVDAELKAHQFRAEVFRAINSLSLRCSITSLERANVAELALSEIDLNDCRFAGAHGLDKIRIGSNCSFLWAPSWLNWNRFTPSRMYTRRRLLCEEVNWRRAPEAAYSHSPLDVSTIYRDLRKSLEDAKNEPAAADFYYGEMEMRRLSRRKFSASTGKIERGTPFIERVLLTAYWALSGYGLRASRALLALVFLVLIAANMLTHEQYATLSSPQPQIESVDLSSGVVHMTSPPRDIEPSFPIALEYAARQSLSLLQTRSAIPELVTHGLGTWLDFLLRFAGPALLALAILAVRGRTKR